MKVNPTRIQHHPATDESPGPWRFQLTLRYERILDANGKVVADLSELDVPTEEDVRAVGNLIAAAPQLYEALQMAYGLYQQALIDRGESTVSIDYIDDVLKRARGEETT